VTNFELAGLQKPSKPSTYLTPSNMATDEEASAYFPSFSLFFFSFTPDGKGDAATEALVLV
jgi:hypothetical protein